MASINGIAHIQLTVTSMERSVPFYRKLLHSLEMVALRDTPDYFYCIGGRKVAGSVPIVMLNVSDPVERAWSRVCRALVASLPA